jgi:phosphate transport system substrate-binding protein
MNKLSIKIVVLFLSSLFFFSCGKKDRGGRTDTRTSGEISFYADESFSPIIEELKKQFEFQFPNAKLNPIYSNENEGFKQIKDLKTCLFFTSRALKPSEVAYLKSKRQLPEVFPIAYDGLAIIVNNSNPDTLITVKDFARILSGEVKEWKEIYPNSKLGEFDVVFDNPKSSTVRYCVDSILGGKPINSANIGAVMKSAEVVDYVENHKNAIGIIGSNWLNDKRDTTNVTFKKEITVMKVSKLDSATVYNSWRPYQFYLYNGNYPLIRTIYALLNEPRSGVPSGFAHFCRLPKGQLIIFKAGLLPIQGNMNVREVMVSSE